MLSSVRLLSSILKLKKKSIFLKYIGSLAAAQQSWVHLVQSQGGQTLRVQPPGGGAPCSPTPAPSQVVLHTQGTRAQVFSGLVAQGLKYSRNTPSAFAMPGVSFNMLVQPASCPASDSALSQRVVAPRVGRGPSPAPGTRRTQLSGQCRSWIRPLQATSVLMMALLLAFAAETGAAELQHPPGMLCWPSVRGSCPAIAFPPTALSARVSLRHSKGFFLLALHLSPCSLPLSDPPASLARPAGVTPTPGAPSVFVSRLHPLGSITGP